MQILSRLAADFLFASSYSFKVTLQGVRLPVGGDTLLPGRTATALTPACPCFSV